MDDTPELIARLRARGDFHRQRGNIKDAELMYEAAAFLEFKRMGEKLRASANVTWQDGITHVSFKK